MQVLTKVWDWIEKNRFLVICTLLAIILWIAAASCTPETASVTQPGRFVNADELQIEFAAWQKDVNMMQMKFEYAGKDLQKQQEQFDKLNKFVIDVASGNVADFKTGLLMLLGGGGLGAIVDNIRKRGVISGLKRNKV